MNRPVEQLPIPMVDGPQRSNALKAFRDALQQIGYPKEQIQQDYGYSSFQKSGQRSEVDMVAFGAPVPSLRTCNIGIALGRTADADNVAWLRPLGAPLVFTYDVKERLLKRWGMRATGAPSILEVLPGFNLDNISAYFVGHRQEWDPESFRQARAATFRETRAQLDFFDVGLLPTLEGELQQKLSIQLQNISARSKEIVDERSGKDAFAKEFASYARLLFRLLAARMLSDRGDLPGVVSNPDAKEVLQIVERKYGVKDVIEPALDIDVVRNFIWEQLRQGLDLSNLSPETLAFVYENTLVDKELKRRRGIHATPPVIADYLLRQLPIEQLPENERVVFEPFCGNAPFLLAAMRRLRELLPVGRTPAEVHSYLTERLLGIEILAFAREIALCSLILGDYPNDNNWKILKEDAFADAGFNRFLQKANIVVCNPPHEPFPIDARNVEAYYNQAAEALRRILINPPKMLGVVMPLAFVDGNHYKTLRQQLIDIYPDITVTALPDSVFRGTGQETALIAAHHLQDRKRYLWGRVSKTDYNDFPIKADSIVYKQHDVLPVLSDGMPILWKLSNSALDSLWKTLEIYPNLGTFAELHRGLEWNIPREQAIFTEEQEFTAPGLDKVTSGIETYVALTIKHLDIRAETALYKARERDWRLPKAIVGQSSMSRGLWRLLAVNDDEGLYSAHNFIGIWPHGYKHSYSHAAVLTALLGSPLANAFVHYNGGDKRHNTKQALERIPVPAFTDSQIGEIAGLVDAYTELRYTYSDQPVPWAGRPAELGRRALLKIDAAVLEAYNLPPELEAALLEQFNGVNRGHLPFAFNGYDTAEWESVKAELADDREGRRIAEEFQNLHRKQNLYGLTEAEQKEFDHLVSLRTQRRMLYRNSLQTSK